MATTIPELTPRRDWALFLDIDGTLLDLAETPNAVVVPEGLLTEHIVPALVGYRGMGPVRVGNQTAEQVQYDVCGRVILTGALD